MVNTTHSILLGVYSMSRGNMFFLDLEPTPSVKRDSSGIRDYTEEDCRWIEFIKCMRNAGLPIEVLIEYVELFQKGDETIEARKSLLSKECDK
jgi:DNA-binding transcriptional MerR regulator